MPPNPPSLRYRIEYIAFRLFGLAMGLLPVESASNLGARLFRRLGPVLRSRYTRILDNLASAYPELTEVERNDLAIAVCENIGRVVCEFFHVEEIARERIECANPEILARLARSSGGSVICAAHQANWEAGAAIMARHGLEPLGVYHPMSNPFVDAAIKRRRARLFPGGLVPKRDPSTPLRVLRHSQRGTVAFLVDQYFHKSPPVRFFGRPAASTTFPAMIARSKGLPLVLLHCVRKPGSRFLITCEEIPVPVTQDRDADILATTAAVQAALERSIRKHPDQWIWSHRRWGWD